MQSRLIRHMARTAFLLVFISITAMDCARFRIEELEPRVVFSTLVTRADAENVAGSVHLLESGRVPFNLPLRPAVNASNAYIADPGRRLIRVFGSGTSDVPEVLLTGEGARLPETAGGGLATRALKFGIPGWVAVDEDNERLYIQSFVKDNSPLESPDQPIENRPSGQTSVLRQVASTVLIVNTDEDYRTVATQGVDGPGSAAFPEILRLSAGDDGLLYVLYRPAEGDGLALGVYRDGTLVRRFVPSAEGILTPEEQRQYFVDWEDIAPGPGGSFVIFSVALRNKSSYDLYSRRIFRQTAPDATPAELVRLDDPADYFAGAREDGGFFLMNAGEDGSRILFKTFSPNGEYLNNRLIVFPGLRAAWRESFVGLNGLIYSSRLYSGRFELYEWN